MQSRRPALGRSASMEREATAHHVLVVPWLVSAIVLVFGRFRSRREADGGNYAVGRIRDVSSEREPGSFPNEIHSSSSPNRKSSNRPLSPMVDVVLHYSVGEPGPKDLGRRLEFPIGALLAPILRVSFA